MTLWSLKTLSSIVTITGCVLVTFLIRRKITFKKLPFNFAIFGKTEKEEKKEEKPFIIDPSTPKVEIYGQDEDEEVEYIHPSTSKYYLYSEISPPVANAIWEKVGHVKSLNISPLYAGKKVSFDRVKFTYHGIIVEKENSVIWDRMFQVLDTESKRVKCPDDLRGMELISTEINEPLVKFYNADRSDCLTIDLNKVTSKTSKNMVELKTHWIIITYVDCGNEAAAWMNKYFQKSTLRLLRAEYNIIGEREIEFLDLIKRPPNNSIAMHLLRNVLTRHTMVTSESLEEYKKDEHLKFFKIDPQILISAPEQFTDVDKYCDWIKIGNVILKRFPADNKNKLNLSRVSTHPLYLGLSYRLANGPGYVNVGDEVYIHYYRYKIDD